MPRWGGTRTPQVVVELRQPYVLHGAPLRAARSHQPGRHRHTGTIDDFRPSPTPTARSTRAYLGDTLEVPSRPLHPPAVPGGLPVARPTGIRLRCGSCHDLP